MKCGGRRLIWGENPAVTGHRIRRRPQDPSDCNCDEFAAVVGEDMFALQ